MSDAPSWQDFFDAAKAEMYSRRPDLTWDEGDITEMIASGVGAVGDRLVGLLEQRSVQVDLDIKFAGRAFVQVFFKHSPHLGMPVVRHGRR